MNRWHKTIVAGAYGVLQLVNVLVAYGVAGRWVTLVIAGLTAAGVALVPNAAKPTAPVTPTAVAADAGNLLAELVELLDQRYTPPAPAPAAPTPEGLTVVTRPRE